MRLLLYGMYQLSGWIFFIVSFPFFLLYTIVYRQHREGLGQRLGILPPFFISEDGHPRVWLHASSVGEVQLARALLVELKELLPEAHFILSVMTSRGMELARRELGPDVRCIYAPLDLAGIVDRVVTAIRADLYICLETELWPALLVCLRKNGARISLLNGRMSQRSFKRYSLVRQFLADTLDLFSIIGVISNEDGRRYIELGARPERVRVVGNAKYDLAAASFSPETAHTYRIRLQLGKGIPIFLAGSTHTGEEKMLLSVFEELRKDTRLRDLVWIVVPRHLQRLGEVEVLFTRRGIGWQRMSDIEKNGRNHDVIVVDSVGELAGLYSVADYIFCGGSLVERGGHNVMEAAIYGRPVFYGPHMADFQDAVDMLESAGCGIMIADEKELLAGILHFLDHEGEYRAAGENAARTARAQIGSARRQALLADELLRTDHQ